MNDKIKEKLKVNIAISQIKNEEEKAMNKKELFVLKNIGIAACVLISLSGVVFAGNKIIENIWKTPQKINNATNEITEESKKENISEEQAKEIAVNKLKEVNLNFNIIETRHYKEANSNRIMYTFVTEDNYSINIDGKAGEFRSISNYDINQDINVSISQEEAIEAANEYLKLFGLKTENYEITYIWSNNKEGSGKGAGFKIDIVYSKKYGNISNPFESISISINSKDKDFYYINLTNEPFDNNEIIITEDEAIQIALKEDEKIKTNKIIETKAKQMIVKMNTEAYERINNTEVYYNSMKNTDIHRDVYSIDFKIRNAWVVVITYEDTFDNLMDRYTLSQYSYFVDCTTGEIIGGHVMDYTAWN